ncbi:MAG: hypothetical protein WCL50_12145 [Spirochaetota bacterium]
MERSETLIPTFPNFQFLAEVERFRASAFVAPPAQGVGTLAARELEAAGFLEKLPTLGSWLDRLGGGSKMEMPISPRADSLVSTQRRYFITDTAAVLELEGAMEELKGI